MAVAVGDVLLVTCVGHLLEQTILNTFHYGVETVVGAPTQAAFATEVFAKMNVAGGFVDKMMNCCPTNYELTEVWVQFILDTRYRKSVFAAGNAGTGAGRSDAANVASVISRFGAAANRYNQGSVHLPLPTTGGITDGLVAGAVNTELNLFKPFLFNPLVLATLGTIQPILISGTSKLNAKPVVAATAQDTVRTMRRRGLRLGI